MSADSPGTVRVAPTPRSVAAALVLLLVVAVGIGLVARMTRLGIGTSPDSVRYLQTAEQWLGQGARSGPPSQQHGPLYPAVLAAASALHGDALAAARGLNLFLFGLNVWLVGWIAGRLWPSLTARLFASAFAALSLPFLTAHAMVLSEPLFLPLAFGGLAMLAKYLDGAPDGWLLGAGAALTLAVLTRYAALACVATAFAAMAIWGRHSVGRRAVIAALFAASCTAPLLLWLAWNSAVAGTSTNRELSFHPVTVGHARQALHTLSGWLLIPPGVPDLAIAAAWLLLVGGVARLLMMQRSLPRLVGVFALFAVFYAAFLAVSISFIDANTPLDDRILLPLLVTVLLLFVYLAHWWRQRWAGRGVAVFVTAVAALITAHGIRASTVVVEASEHGLGFTSVGWRRSPTLSHVRTMPAGRLLYSNAPEGVYLHTGRAPRRIPRRRLLMIREANPRFDDEMAQMARDLESACGVVVYLRLVGPQPSLPSEHELRRRLNLRSIRENRDGAILAPGTCGP